MTGDRLARLRAEVASHAGPARARPLTELGRELANEYWRAGPGQPEAAALLDEAVTVLEEAYGHLETGQGPRIRTAAMAGWLRGSRHVAHRRDVEDRERAIVLLDEALAGRPREPGLLAISRVVLGQLLLSRPLEQLTSGGLDPRPLMSGRPGGDRADIDRAIDCFRPVIDTPGVPAAASEMARTMLGVAETLQSMVGGPGRTGGLDFARLAASFQALSPLQAQASAASSGPGGSGTSSPFAFVADEIARQPPPDRPVAMVGTGPEIAGPRADTAPAVPRVPAAELREAFRAALPAGSVGALLVPGRPAPDADTVDRMVARSAALLDAEDADDGDRVLRAVALYHRGLVRGDGWGDGGPDVLDLRGAGDDLLAARLTRARAGTVVDAVRLAELLDERDPALAVTDRLGEQFREVGEVLRGAAVDAVVYPTPDGALLLYDVDGGFGRVPVAQLPGRVVVAGEPPRGVESVCSVVRSAAQAAELVRRRRRHPGEGAVFVANPRGDRAQASVEAMLLRRTFYPRSTGLGRTVENADGDGTPAEVRARLDASVLHLACGVTAAGDLELAGPAVLSAAEISSATGAGDGGVAILPPGPRGAEPLADALLAAGFSGAVAFRADMPASAASLVYVLLHAELVDRGTEPAHAVARVRRWLRDPGRVLPDYLPSWYAATAGETDIADPVMVEAVVHHGV